jgi:hypothetical protein
MVRLERSLPSDANTGLLGGEARNDSNPERRRRNAGAFETTSEEGIAAPRAVERTDEF